MLGWLTRSLSGRRHRILGWQAVLLLTLTVACTSTSPPPEEPGKTPPLRKEAHEPRPVAERPPVEHLDAVDSGLQDTAYPFEPEVIVLWGELRSEHRYGPPNYGETPEQDAKLAVWILTLPEPITAGTPETLDEVNTEPVADVREVQIRFSNGAAPTVGLVEVEGKLGVQVAGSDFLPVLLREARVR